MSGDQEEQLMTYLTTTTESGKTKSLNIDKSPIIFYLLQDVEQNKIISLLAALRCGLGRVYDILVCVTTIWKLLD